ncbi:MAG: alanine racemase [Pseudomonadota bacterium]
MPPFPPLPEVACLLGARLVGAGGPVRGAAIDSRRVRPGDLFFALRGQQADGHRFVGQALAAGAAAAVVGPGCLSADGPLLVVPDPLAALQALAAWYRRAHIARVLAITGSNGKTIVKDAVVALLAGHCALASSPGSHNSQVGVPLSVLGAPPGTALGVFEAGVSAPGEMARLAAILAPDCGVLTNVGLAHIAGFGRREVTAREKMALFAGIGPAGWALLPAGDPVVDTVAGDLGCRLLRHGADEPALPRLRALVPNGAGAVLQLTLPSGRELALPVATRSPHLVQDLLVAMGAALLLGLPEEGLPARLDGFSFGATRMELWRTPEGVTIVNDACSSDPLSVQAALAAVSAHAPGQGRRIFVFGGMGELGERTEAEHRLIGTLAAQQGFSSLVLLDQPGLDATAAAFQAACPAGEVHRVSSPEALSATVHPLARAGDTILVKGPRHEGLAQAARLLWESMAPTRLIVDLGAVRENVARLRGAGPARPMVLAMLKAWAYGTEFSRMATWLQQSGVDWIGVAAADEGAMARRAGVHLPILVTLMSGEEADKALRYRLTPVVYSLAQAAGLAAEVRRQGGQLDVHIEIDTGMGRVGVRPEELPEACALVLGSGVLTPTGLMTHLSSADDPEADSYTRAQLARFEACLAVARGAGMRDFLVHAAATSGALRFPEARYDMIRAGLGLYGIYGSPALQRVLQLQLALSLVSRLVHIATFQAGERVGYAGAYVVPRDGVRVGIVGMGYNDGVPWSLSNRGEVLVNGQPAPILGRVSMDSMAVDLSACPGAAPGDEVLIFGAREGAVLRPEEVAAQAGTIPYELLVRVDSRRVQRIFVGE